MQQMNRVISKGSGLKSFFFILQFGMGILQWVTTYLEKLRKGFAKTQKSKANSPTTASLQQQQLEH